MVGCLLDDASAGVVIVTDVVAEAHQLDLSGLDALDVSGDILLRFESTDVIFRESETANEFYLIRTGTVALQLFADRRGPLIVLTLEEGDVLGWSWRSPPYHWKFTACALETTNAISLDGKCIREKAETDHDLGYELLKRFVHVNEGRIRATSLRLPSVYEG